MNELELEIFRCGDYGPKGRWTENALDRLVSGYDPSLHEAPVTLDHAQSGPALGWVASLARRGDRLVARLRGLNDHLVSLLRDGAFKKRSAEIFRALPETGEPYLKAVSFLGAAAPAVRGLHDVLFSDGEPHAQLRADTAETDCFDLDANPANAERKDDPVNRFLPEGQPGPSSGAGLPVCGAESHANRSEPAAAASHSDSRVHAATPADADTPTSALTFADLTDPLRQANRWLPAWEERGIASFFDALASAPAFAPRAGETITPQRWFADFLASLPESVPLGEAAPASTAPFHLNGMISSVERASPDSLELHRRVLMLRESQPHLSYAQALREVARH